MPVRLVSNESACPPDQVLRHCEEAGLQVKIEEIFVTTPAAYKVIAEKKLRPYVLVHENVEQFFSTLDQTNPNCVLIGDAVHNFSYDRLNTAFRILMAPHPPEEQPQLFSLGMGKYYRKGGSGELSMDVGPFTRALEFATGVTAQVIGKPSKMYFEAALKDVGVEASEAIMIGDDILNDVGGAQNVDMQAVLPRTGKYRPSDEAHPSVTPDLVVDNFAAFVDFVLEHIQ